MLENHYPKATFFSPGWHREDLEMLYGLQFDTIELILINGKKTRKILVSKISKDLEYRSLEYKIGSNKYDLPILSADTSKAKQELGWEAEIGIDQSLEDIYKAMSK